MFYVYATHKVTDATHDLGEVEASSKENAVKELGRGWPSEHYSVWASTGSMMFTGDTRFENDLDSNDDEPDWWPEDDFDDEDERFGDLPLPPEDND
jgi:hypothetical protein